jgi:hypothetical protein
LCGVEFSPPGDSRIAIGRGGSLVCWFRSSAETLGAPDVNIDVSGEIMQSHTVSSLREGVWQANLLLTEPIEEGKPVRLRLGRGLWSEALPVRRKT